MLCPVCERDCPDDRMTRHHLKTRSKDRFDVELICADCHTSIHALFTNQQLRDERLGLDTVEGLLANEQFAKTVAFLKKAAPHRRTRTKMSNARRSRSRRRR